MAGIGNRKGMEIINEIAITEEELNKLEMHSVINLITVISSQLQIIEATTDFPEKISPLTEQVSELAHAARRQDRTLFNINTVKQLRQNLISTLISLSEIQPTLNDGHPVIDYIPVFQEILDIASIRIDELNRRWRDPDGWETFSAHYFQEEFKQFFHTLEVNSKGRYRIIYNIAEQEDRDYLVNFTVSGDEDGQIHMPLLLKDVIRDLISNARKYTPLGGKIDVGISVSKELFRFVVEDSGHGIPEDEIEKVVEFGFRGSNVRDTIRTMGGGFGLTKAWFVTKKLKGRMWIESELKRGTKISLQIPLPDHITKGA